MNKLRAIIFDLDGTLIDSSEGVVAAVNYSLAQVGEPPQPPERITPFIGYPLEVMYPEFTDAPLDELFSHFRVKAAETVVTSTVTLPGADQALSKLHGSGYRLAIASTKIRPHIDGVIDKFGWSRLIEARAGGDEVVHVKPAPDIFELALERLGLGPDDAIVVGDTVNDVRAAHTAGMRVVAVDSPYTSRDDIATSQPDYRLLSVSELPALFERWSGNRA